MCGSQVLRGKAGEPMGPGFSRTIHYEISGAGRIGPRRRWPPGGHRVDTETGMAEAFASETALECAVISMYIHGGYGYSKEFVVERLYRDAPLMSIGEGTNDIQRLIIARRLVSGESSVG
jgi:alkylation response protein AidB-like acyl-CoA dehydrogenase